MSLGVTPIDATLGAVVTGVDLAALDDENLEGDSPDFSEVRGASPHFLSVLITRSWTLGKVPLRRSHDRRRGRWWTVHFSALGAVGE